MTPTARRRPDASHPRRPPLGTGEIVTVDLGAFVPETGGTPLPLTLAYRHDGPGPDAPQVLVVHALTGSADAAGDWWQPLIGPGRVLDTDRVGVLCANLLGGRYGSTGPTTINPVTGQPWGDSFPVISARDEARALWLLADALGIERFALVTGGSLGGMIALEVAVARPFGVAHVAPIAAPVATGGLALAWNHIQLELLDRLGDDGLALARQLAMTTYRSETDFDSRFGRGHEADGRFSVASYLDHQGSKLVDRFDAETYRVLVRVIDSHDIGRDRGGAAAALRPLARVGSGLTGVGVEGDILYGPGQVQELVDTAGSVGVDAGYREIHSPKGHDAFLTEWDQLAPALSEAIEDGIARLAARDAASDIEAGVA
jgi:homoserine O-acetyltransferase/O-succinyltransferase